MWSLHYSAEFTLHCGVYTTARSLHYIAEFTLQRGVYTTAQSLHYSAEFTLQRGVYTTVRSLHYSAVGISSTTDVTLRPADFGLSPVTNKTNAHR